MNFKYKKGQKFYSVFFFKTIAFWYKIRYNIYVFNLSITDGGF